MPHIRALFQFFDYISLTFLSITFIDMVNFMQNDIITFKEVEGTVFQYVYICIGLGYFIINGYNNYQAKKQERQQKALEIKKLQDEIDMQKWENAEKKSEK